MKHKFIDEKVLELREKVKKNPELVPIPKETIAIKAMICEILEAYRFTFEEIKEFNRESQILAPRRLIMAMMAWHSKLSLKEIGKACNRHHSNILFARKKMTEDMKESDQAKRIVYSLEKRHLGIVDHHNVERRGRHNPYNYGLMLNEK